MKLPIARLFYLLNARLEAKWNVAYFAKKYIDIG
jgi:hypothetical protein